MTQQQLSLLDPPTAQSRRSDPASSKRAAAWNPEGRASQAARILRWLWAHSSITADQAFRELTADGEDVQRNEWSTRIGVLKKRGLLEVAGEVDEVDRKGRPSRVLAYRLTLAGRAEVDLMFGGHQ